MIRHLFCEFFFLFLKLNSRYFYYYDYLLPMAMYVIVYEYVAVEACDVEALDICSCSFVFALHFASYMLDCILRYIYCIICKSLHDVYIFQVTMPIKSWFANLKVWNNFLLIESKFIQICFWVIDSILIFILIWV